MIYSIYVVNKSGGLIYYYECSKPLPERQRSVPLSMNECLTLASLFHGLNAVSIELSPIPGCIGIQTFKTDGFVLHNYIAPTGIKFFALSDFVEKNLDNVLFSLYGLYCDYALKNPFYSSDMPIRSEKFDHYVHKYMQSANK